MKMRRSVFFSSITLITLLGLGAFFYTKRFDGVIGTDIVACKDGGVLVIGSRFSGVSFVTSQHQQVLIRLDADGKEIWRHLDEPGFLHGRAGIQARNGDFIVLGTATHFHGTPTLTRIDSKGSVRWTRSYPRFDGVVSEVVESSSGELTFSMDDELSGFIVIRT